MPDFADFAAKESTSVQAHNPIATLLANADKIDPASYTKWYEIHKRNSLSDFKMEGYILAFAIVLFTIHFYGVRANRRRAAKWAEVHAPVMQKEYALVGFGPKQATIADAEGAGLARTLDGAAAVKVIKEKSLSSFVSYCTGRQNVAFVDVELTLLKRYNPIVLAIEYLGSFLMESIEHPVEMIDAVMYPFDGQEARTVPGLLPGTKELNTKSHYDNFVFAIVNKDVMKKLRDDRFDLSITSTKDHPKLPIWATVMSEAHEITEAMLTPELISAVESAGDNFEHLIITDQPINKPEVVEECVSKKRVYLSMKLPSSDEGYAACLPMFEYFLSITDRLVEKAHWTNLINKKLNATREVQKNKLQKIIDAEKEEEHKLEREKIKKIKRDAELKKLSAKDQKKYLEKEKEREMKKSMKRGTVKG